MKPSILFCLLVFLCPLFVFSQISIIGSATPAADWTTDFDLDQDPTNSSVWTGQILLQKDSLFKFRENNEWTVNWGADNFPTGSLIENGANIMVDSTATYYMTLDLTALTYGSEIVPVPAMTLSAQKVGVNLAVPEYTLDVRSPNNNAPGQFNVSNLDKSRYLRFFSGSEMFPDPSMSWNPGHNFIFATFDDATFNFTEYMRIDALGRVGIGVTDPSAKLEVSGQVKITGGNPGIGKVLVSDSDGLGSWAPAPSQSSDTSRTLQSDLLLTSALCNCTSLPPAMIQSLLNNGYSIQDLADFQIPTQDLLAGGLSIQDLLDGGQTPLALYNDGIVLDSLYGKLYAGGMLFSLNTTTGAGLVAAQMDQSTGTSWGCQGSIIVGADGTGYGTGSQNTIDIDAGCVLADIAADLCINLSFNGYDDWFLPSRDELEGMNSSIGRAFGANNAGNFPIAVYWSSSEQDADFAYSYQFGINDWTVSLKNSASNRVRAVRAF